MAAGVRTQAEPTAMARSFLILSARLTGIMARFAARELASATSVRGYEIPAAVPPRPISAGWHARYDADPEHRWLRSQVQDIASELAGTAASSARVQSR
jgi:DNA-binding transcriptional LysR family regulator